MARTLINDQEIDNFVDQIQDQANHHAPGVNLIIGDLSKAVRMRLSSAQDTVQVYEREGNLARTCWVTISGNRYAFSYNYESETIILKKRSIQGTVLAEFSNATNLADLQRAINSL